MSRDGEEICKQYRERSNVSETSSERKSRKDRRERVSLENNLARQQLQADLPLAPYGMMFERVPVELYLEEITDRVLETEVASQTDMFVVNSSLEKTAVYVPAKTGQDAATQVEDDDLFNFSLEVVPLLEVLVGKTVEQALLEVAQEEDLANIRQRLRSFQELCNADLVHLQKMEYNDARLREEREHRNEEAERHNRMQTETTEKLAVYSYVKRYCKDIEAVVFGQLNTFGYFFDPVQRDIEEGFLKQLDENVSQQINNVAISRVILDQMIQELSCQRKGHYGQLDRSKAEWKLIESQAIRPLHEKVSEMTASEMELLIEHVFYLANEATSLVNVTVCDAAIKLAADQYSLEEAAAKTALEAVDDVE